MQVVFFKPEVEFEADKDELWPYAAQIKISVPVFKRIRQHVRETGIGLEEFLLSAAIVKMAQDLNLDPTTILRQIVDFGGAK